MPVVNTKATAVTNADAASQTLSNTKIQGARTYESVGTLEAVIADSIASTYRLARVKSGERISRVLLSCDAITTCAADVGIYDVAAVNGGAVIDADFFASAVSLAAALVNLDVTHEADPADAGTGFGLQDVEKPLWQALGLAADPNKWYDVALTLTAAAASAGTVSLKVLTVTGN